MKYGPYYPVSDLKWEDKEQKIDEIFSDWTFCQVYEANSKYIYDEGTGTYKKYWDASKTNWNGFVGITGDEDIMARDLDLTKNTIYFNTITFNIYPMLSTPGIEEFIMDFHKLKMKEEAEGMIIDMRGNVGGYNLDRQYLFGDLFSEPHIFGYEKNKTGAGRFDYSLEFPLYIYPEAEYFNNEFSSISSKPVVVVTNSGSGSNAEMVVFMVRTIEKGGQVGSKTFGSTGTIIANIFAVNSGVFSIGNYIKVESSPYGRLYDANHVSHESVGLVPDEGYEVRFSLEDFNIEKALRLNTAFQWIRDNR